MQYDFALFGLGKVGGAMCTLLKQAGHRPVWVVSSKEAQGDIPFHKDVPSGPAGAKVVFLTVPDKAIRVVAEKIAAVWKGSCRGLCFFHMSGLHTSELLEPLTRYGAYTGSLHPLQAIMDPALALDAVRNAYFVFEGCDEARAIAQDLVVSLSSTLITISGKDKVVYHAAAVIASNYLVALASQASKLMSSVGMGMKELIPLIKSTVGNIETYGPPALTGPIQRGDWNTVLKHLEALTSRFPDILPSYVSLGRYTARLASRAWPERFEAKDKLLDRRMFSERVKAMRGSGMKVVFTNGCFDILHEGHVSYLEEARALGDALVLGLNSDESVRRLKGMDRPVNNERSRAAVLSALSCIDYLCVFEEDTPYELIDEARPDVLVKGGDWEPDRIVGADIVKSYGGEVRSLKFRPGHSTTGIIEKIKSL